MVQTKGFVLCEYEKVKEEFPEFLNTMAKLEADLTAMALADWAPLTYGGIYPKSGQFGKSTIMPELFYGFGQVAPTLTTWTTFATATGHQGLLAGAHAMNIYEDYKIGIAGFAFLDKVQRVTEIKLQIGDKKFPRINLEESFVYNKPAVILETGILVDEETEFDLHGFVECIGPYKIMPIGIQMNRVPNKLQTSQTTAALQ
jgi:hypothetical protein